MTRRSRVTSGEVVVLLKDAALLFALPPGATFEQLAQHVAGIEERLRGHAVAIDLHLRH